MGDALCFVLGPTGLRNRVPGATAELGALLSARMAREIVLESVPSYAQILDRIASGSGHFAWLPPVLVVEALDRIRVALLASAVRSSGSRYHGALFVPGDHPARTIDALAGRRVAWVDPRSASGHLFPRLALADRGLPRTFFGEEAFLGSHRAVVAAVRDGEADLGATYVHFPEDQHRVPVGSGWHDIGFERMRALLVSDPIPADAVCAAPYVDAPTREQMSDLLCTFHTRPGAHLLHAVLDAASMEPTVPSRYQTVRRALALAPL